MHTNQRKGDFWTIVSLWTRTLEVALVGAMLICMWMSTPVWIDY